MARARSVAEVIAGEAVSGTPEQRMADMRAIASVIANRAALLGVTPEQVVSNSNEFNAYNRSLPPGVGQQIIDMAQEQIDYVAANGPVNNATFYATPSAVGNLPNGLSYEDATSGHQYFSDPQNRAIGTANGYVRPNPYAYAQNLDVASIPAPYAPKDLTSNSLLSAFSQTPTYSEDPFNAILSPQAPVDNWGQLAAAGPMTAPMDSVTASGLLGATPSLTAAAKANPMMSLAAEGLLGTNPGMSANATVAGLPEVTSADPNFDLSRFEGLGQSVGAMDASRLYSDPKTSRIGQLPGLTDTARMNPLTGAIDPATNTQSFMDQPAAPADLGSFADGYAAQRGPSTGLLSADAQTTQGRAQIAYQNALQDQQLNSFAPQMNVPATGLLAGNAPLAAQATVPSLMTQETVQDVVTPTATGLGLLSPDSLVSASPSLTTTMPTGIIGAQPVQQNAFVDSFPSAVANNTIEPATVNDVVAAPTLDTMQISEQPSIASVEGPATTPALDQQEQQAAQTDQATASNTPARSMTSPQIANKPTLGQKITNAINPGTIGGGLLGGLAAGPVGGLLGGLLGNSVYSNGGLTGLLGSQPMSINNIGGGLANTASIWGGGQPMGTQATASDGQSITSMGNGYTAVTGRTGAVTVFDNNGKAMGYFGSALGDDNDAPSTSTSSGGLFGGFFG